MRILYNYTTGIPILLLLCHPSFSQGIYNSAHIIVSGNASITVQDGGFHNNGVFEPGTGTLVIAGTAATPTAAIGGTSSTAFNNLSIDKTSNGAVLTGNISINGNLRMQAGNLDLNLFNIDLGSGAGTIMNENNNARITGTGGGNILKTASLHAPAAANPGNLGIAISSTADLGSTLIKRGYQQQTITGGGLSIYRYYDITPTNNALLNASLQMYYFDNELAGLNKSELNFYNSEDNGVTWTLTGKDNSDPINDWVLKNNIGQLSRWTLASNTNSSLPVKLISFTAGLLNRQTKLQWVTAQEINSSYFDVQRSQDGTAFNKLLSVPAQGNSNLQHTYNATDDHPLNGINYYRLKEVDRDGQSSFSSIVYVKLDNGASYAVYPNPAVGVFYLDINLPAAQRSAIGLYDVNGQLLQKKDVQLSGGSNQLLWNISQLAGGIYFLRSANNTSMPVLKVIKK